MAGVAGRSGRPRKPIAEHLARGTYRRDRHGPLTVVSSALPAAPPLAPPDPPPGLSAQSAALWRELLADFDGWQAGDLALLTLALQALDDARAARAQLAADGLVLTG